MEVTVLGKAATGQTLPQSGFRSHAFYITQDHGTKASLKVCSASGCHSSCTAQLAGLHMAFMWVAAIS